MQARTKLDAILTQHGISQRELAEAIDRSEATASRLASGAIEPSLETIDAVLAFLSKRLRRRVTYEQVFASRAVVA